MAGDPGAGLRGQWRFDEPMSRHTSWRTGGAAERFYIPADLADLCNLLRTMPCDEPVYFVGLGSNLLVRDGGLAGTVVLTHGTLQAFTLGPADHGGAWIDAQAGVAAPKVARAAARAGLEGAQFLAGVPGTVGGALAMNAGCYGGETWRFVTRLTTVDRAGHLHVRGPQEYQVGYREVALRDAGGCMQGEDREMKGGRQKGDAERGSRTSIAGGLSHPSPCMPAPAQEWFVGVRFRFPRGDAAYAQATIRELLTRRIETQPLAQPSAGSVFRNPQGDHAARLIEACGLKGHTLQGAQVSRKHANFIVNLGQATASAIEALIEKVRDEVARRTGVQLVLEARIVGTK
jgi:UDP-N-acetylmuramate dehydrogenase